MKLDPRIIEGKRPLSCLDTDEAKKFIGKKGYFAQNLKQFADLNCILLGELLSVTTDEFFCRGLDIGYNFFMSAEWVQEQEPEPVWKPYDLDTWQNDYNMGRIITFRYAAIPNDNTVTVFYHGQTLTSITKLMAVLGQKPLV